MTRGTRLAGVAMLAAVVVPAALASACPTCKESIPNSDAQQAGSLPGGFNASIYYMLGGVGLVGGLVLRMLVREARATDLAAASRHSGRQRPGS